MIINDGIAYEDLPCIHTDHYHGMRELLIHLIERHGYRKIAFIRGPEGDRAVQDRYRAYVDTLADYVEGITTDLFLSTLRMVLLQAMEANEDLTEWHGIIAALRRCVLPSLFEHNACLAETLLHQAQIAIGETVRRMQAHQRMK